MSGARHGWQGTVKIPVAEEPVSPNRQDPYVSVHVRVYWPYTATYVEVAHAMQDAFHKASSEALASYRKDRGL